MTTIWDSMDDIIVISLQEATERRVAVAEELQRAGITNYRFLLVDRPENKNGIYGCYTSHQRALQESKTSGYKRVCIFEDDIHFDDDLIVAHEAYNAFINAGVTWDFLMLGWLPVAASATNIPNILKVKCATTTHAYIANESMINLGLPDVSPDLSTGVDITLFCSSCKPNDVNFSMFCRTKYEVYAIRPSIVHQSFDDSFIQTSTHMFFLNIFNYMFPTKRIEKHVEYMSVPAMNMTIILATCITLVLIITLCVVYKK